MFPDGRSVPALDFGASDKTGKGLFPSHIRLPLEHADKCITQVLAGLAQVNFVLITSEDLKSFRPPRDDVAANLAADVSVGFTSACDSRIRARIHGHPILSFLTPLLRQLVVNEYHVSF